MMMSTIDWTGLSNDQLRLRLERKGMGREQAATLALNRSTPDARKFIERVLSRAWRDW